MVHVESTKAGCLWIVATHAGKLGAKIDEYCKRVLRRSWRTVCSQEK